MKCWHVKGNTIDRWHAKLLHMVITQTIWHTMTGVSNALKITDNTDLIWPSDRLEITYNFENWMRYMYVKRQCSTCIFLCFLVEPCRIVPKLCWDSFRHYEYGGQFDRIYHTLGGRKHYQLQCKNEVTLACLPPKDQPNGFFMTFSIFSFSKH